MIRKLRIKFVSCAMIVLMIVTFSIFGFITYENYKINNTKAETILNFIAENNGEFPEYSPHQNFNGIITKETKFSTRYFYANLNSSNQITKINVQNVAAVTENEAKQIIEKILKNSKNSGYYENYKYKIINKENNSKLVIILDCSFQLNSLKEFTNKAVFIISSGLIIVFFMLSALSKQILSPIINNIEKQKQFISNAGHELKTPIAVIVANAEVMEMTETSKENIELIKSIKKQAQRLNELTITLLNLAKSEEGKTQNEYSEFSITKMIQDEINEFKTLAKEKEIIFNCSNNINIKANKNNIKELIIIFLDNSIKYSDENGKIIVKAEKQGKNVKIQFMNTCQNAKSINVTKIFDRFYREDKSRNKKKEGYGIGLSMAKSIVDMHKGKISANITKDNMICFTIIL